MQDLDSASKKNGFVKIEKSCELARQANIDWVWVDTCCINKESSAELSEAINSMYRWYATLVVCYAFLSDVCMNGRSPEMEEQIKRSLWFTCGWTLQELLAPKFVDFFNRNWELLGSKQKMSKLLTLCTGIAEGIFHDRELLFSQSIAQRMSWASKRSTIRIEDVAYCLLGIFDVNMPMLYGEGEKAFLRLQEEIIKQTDDQTIFAWSIYHGWPGGLLANSPARFANCQYIISQPHKDSAEPFAMTNRGLSIKMKVRQHMLDTYVVYLNCQDKTPTTRGIDDRPMSIYMRRLDEDDQYARVNLKRGYLRENLQVRFWMRKSSGFEENIDNPAYKCQDLRMIVRQHRVQSFPDFQSNRITGFRFTRSTIPVIEKGNFVIKIVSDKIVIGSWNAEERIVSTVPSKDGLPHPLAVDLQHPQHGGVRISFGSEWNPICFITSDHEQTGDGIERVNLLEAKSR